MFVLCLQFISPVFAFTDTKANPFTNIIYSHDDRFSKSEILYGVDISQYQPTVDFATLKANGIDFVFIRAAYRGSSNGGLYKDTLFSKHVIAARQAGLDVGAYIYSQAITVAEAREEATYILNIVKNYDITLPLVFDFEYAESSSSRLVSAKLTNKQQTSICNAFCKRVENNGYTAIVYANQSMLTDDLNDEEIAKNYDIWLANYSSKPKYAGKLYETDYSYWQYSSTGKVSGISGNVDCNFRYYKVPDKVQGLAISEETATGTTIKWSKVKGCYGYEVYKNDLDSGEFLLVSTLKGAGSVSYTDTLSSSMPNTYKVRAINAYKNTFDAGEFSDELSSKGVYLTNVVVMSATFTSLAWTEYKNADDYEILRADSVDGDYQVVGTTNGDTKEYTDTTNEPFKTYYYKIRASVYNDEGTEIISSICTPSVEVIKDQPTILSVTLKTAGSIEICWENPKGATGVEVFRSADGGEFKKVKTLSGNSSSYLNQKLTRGKEFTYKIRQFATYDGKKYYSDFTSVKSATTLIKPTIKLKTPAKKQVAITFNSVKSANGYEIFMKAPNGKYTRIKTTTKLTFTKKKLTSNRYYKFKVRAYKKVNGVKVYSAYSKVKTIKVK